MHFSFKFILLFRAIKRVDYPPHPLALHMLGWMSELEVNHEFLYFIHLFHLLNLNLIGRSPSGRTILLSRLAAGAGRAPYIFTIIQHDTEDF